MGFYYHLFMTTFLPCAYGHRKARVAPQAPFPKIK